MTMALAFNETQFTPVIRNSQPWIRSTELAHALGYKDEASVSRIYNRNADEFSNDMSQTVKLTVRDMPVETRIFSLRGCHLLAMFARTPVAKAFRKWVLDILDSMAPSTDTITPDQQCTLQAIVKAKVEALPEEQRKGKYPQIWGRFNNHFRLAKYSQLPQTRMSDAVAYLTQLELAAPAVEAARALPATRTKKKYAIGLVGYLEEMQDIVSEVHEKLTTRSASLFLALDQHSHKVPLSLNEELLLQSVHDYTDMAITGANLLLAGIEGTKRIKRVHSFKHYE